METVNSVTYDKHGDTQSPFGLHTDLFHHILINPRKTYKYYTGGLQKIHSNIILIYIFKNSKVYMNCDGITITDRGTTSQHSSLVGQQTSFSQRS